MRCSIARLFLIFFVGTNAFNTSQAATTHAKITFDADLEIIGPGVETWHIKYAGGNWIKLRVAVLNGSLEGKFLVSDQYLSDLADAVETEEFFKLPRVVNDAFATTDATGHRAITNPVDGPRLRLQMSVNGKAHSVEVPSPKLQSDLPDVKRVMAVMDRVLHILPFKPNWK